MIESEKAVVVQIREVCASVFGVPVSDVPATASPAELPMWDSLYHFTLVAALEDHFGVAFTSDEIPTMRSIPSILNVTLGHLRQAIAD